MVEGAWISVKSRMPRSPDRHDTCSDVVVVAEILEVGDDSDLEIRNIGFARQTAYGVEWIERSSTKFLFWKPTHWYPLPATPLSVDNVGQATATGE
jgi:hypothetical protein